MNRDKDFSNEYYQKRRTNKIVIAVFVSITVVLYGYLIFL